LKLYYLYRQKATRKRPRFIERYHCCAYKIYAEVLRNRLETEIKDIGKPGRLQERKVDD